MWTVSTLSLSSFPTHVLPVLSLRKRLCNLCVPPKFHNLPSRGNINVGLVIRVAGFHVRVRQIGEWDLFPWNGRGRRLASIPRESRGVVTPASLGYPLSITEFSIKTPPSKSLGSYKKNREFTIHSWTSPISSISIVALHFFCQADIPNFAPN